MAGTKLSNLNATTSLQTTDDLLIARSGASYRVQAGRFFEALTGVKLAQNATTNGIPVYKETINVTNGTKLMFHSLSADTGITATLAGDVIKFTISNNSIDTNKIINSAVDANKLASNAVTTAKVLNGAITPAKMSGSLYSVSTKTDIQTIPGGARVMVAGLSATVTPPSTNSVVLLNGYLSVGVIYGSYSIVRSVAGVSPASGVYVARGVSVGNRTSAQMALIRDHNDRNPTCSPINFIDVPNTTSAVTYAIEVDSNSTGYISYINRGYADNDNDYCTRTTCHLAALVLP